MIKSMTGYGIGAFQNEAYKITIEIRTLNSRYLEVHVHPPKELPDIEPEIKKALTEVIKRGRVDLNCSLETNKEENFEINTRVVSRYIQLFQKLKKQFKLSGDINIFAISQLPGVLSIKNNDLPLRAKKFRNHLNAALQDAIKSVDKMRVQEGASIKTDIRRRLKLIERNLATIETESTQIFEHYRTRLQQRLRELTQNLDLDEGRLIQEAVLYAERSDISEEITRLKSHLAQFHKLIEDGEEIGKKLDFLLQELNREITTILSKAGGVQIGTPAITIKAEVEKIREQIQNIE